MDRLLLPCVLLFVMLAVAPAASAMPVDPVAVSAQQSCSIVGTERNDRLAGTGADDRVCGLGGADRIQGGGGGDVLLGAAGRDLLQGKAGADRLDGGPGNDRAFGGAGADEVRGDSGNDILGGGLGADGLSGGSGRDIVVYGQRGVPVVVTIGAGANDGVAGERDNVKADVESVQGGRGNDTLTGNGRSNRLFGGGGKDRLRGKGGSDVLIAGDGDDSIDAREGAAATGRAAQTGSVDRVVCGGGNDTALVDPVDAVDPSCENVVGGSGSTPPQNPPAQNPPAQNPPAQNPPAPTRPGEPTITTTVAPLAYTEGDPATLVDPGLTVADADDADLEGATVEISAGLQSADELLFTDQLGITGDYDAGVLALTGTSSVANYQTALRSVGYRHTGDGPSAAKTVEFQAADGDGPGPVAAREIAVQAVDDSPTAMNDTAMVAESAAASAVDVLANDTDVDGGSRMVAAVTQSTNGSVVITGGGTGLTYEPNAGYCNDAPGTPRDTFTYTLNGGSTATVTVTVTCSDDPPVAVNDAATVGEDSAASAIDVLANDTDTDSGPKTVASVTQPTNGTVVITGGGTGLTYRPNANYCSATPDSFTYTLNGGSTATVSVTVTCVDDLPTAVDDAATVPEDSAATPLAVLANDSDVDGDATTIASASDPANGTVVLTGGLPGARTGLTYQPDPNYCSATPDTFMYTLNGGATATVSVTVTCGDDAPTAVDDTATVAEDSAAGAIDVLANDTDTDGGAMTIASASDPANGAVVLTGGSAGAHTGLTYEPDANFCGPDTFTYTLNGGSTATVSVTVTCVDDAPTAVDDSASVVEDSPPGAINVLANDTDTDGGPKSIASVTQPANGTVVITGAGSGLTYQPNANYCSATPDTFTYTLNGGDSATVSVTVTCVDDPPTAVNDSKTVAEDAAATAVDVLANDTDVDGGPKSVASVTQSTNGTVVITGAGTGVTYQPNAGYCNDPPGTMPDVFTYTLNGGSTATVSVTVTCNDNPPTAVDDSATVAEDSPASAIDVLANDTDTDGGPRSVASVTQPANGTVVITGGGSGLTYQPNANYCNSQAGGAPDTFTYTLNGGDSATVSVTVTCVDDPPTAVNDSATVAEDSAAAAVVVLANDLNADGGPITIASASDPANGTVAVTGGGTGLTYQPDPNYCSATPDMFTYTLNGGSTATVAMTVTCAPDNPVVDTSAGSASYTENAAATAIDAAVTVSDVDAGTTITGATVRLTGGYAGAEDILALGGTHPDITPVVSGDTLTLSGNATVAAYQAALRAVTYRNSSDAPSTAPRTVTFTVTDDTSRTGSDTKGLTVSAVDDPPTAVADSATVLEDAAATAITVLTNDTDVDAGPRSVASVTQPTNGTVAITGGGTGLTYQPNANYCNTPPGTTPSTFTYTLNGGSSATVSVTVTCGNDAPVADDETFTGNEGAIGNTSLVVNALGDGAPALSSPKKSITGDILNGDSDIDGPGPLTVTAGTFATNDGGSVTIEADGDFIYINDPADNCADTSDFFDYTLSDQNPAGPGPAPGTDTGRVTIAVAGCVWYVNNNDPAGNSGTSRAPFDTLTQAETASAANITVFVFDGDNTATGYGGNGYTMNAGERLIGEHEGLTVDPDQGGPLAGQTLHPANPGAHPTLTATGADVIDLDDANEVRGLTLDPSGAGGGIAGATGDVSGTIDDVNIVDTGTAGSQPGLELTQTTGSFSVSNLVVNNTAATSPPSTATGVRLDRAGTVVFAPASQISITVSGAAGLDVDGISGTPVALGTSTFDDITVSGSSAGGVSLTQTSGTINFGDGTGTDLSLTTTSGSAPAFELNNAGTVSVPAAGTANVNATGGPAVDVTGTTVSTLAFDAVNSTNSANDGINLDGLGTGTFTAASGTITGAAGIAFDLNGGSGDVTFPGTITNGQGSTAEITGRTGGTVTLSGPITESGDTDATQENGGIAVTGNSGGSTVVNNATKTFNTGEDHAIIMGTSDGHTLTVSGGSLDIDTTSGKGLEATTSGTLSVTGSSNTIDSTSATALNVTNTDIGAGGLPFQRVSSGNNTADPDPANGIVLSGTGTAGGLTVAGDGTLARNGSGGTIQNTTDDGVALTNANGVSLRSMNFTGDGDTAPSGPAEAENTVGEHAIQISGGSNVVLSGALVSDPSGSGLVALNLGGTNRINSDSLFTSFAEGTRHGIYVNNVDTNMTLFDFDDSAMTNSLNDASMFWFSNTGTSNMTLHVHGGAVFENLDVQALTVAGGGTAATTGTLTSTIEDSVFQNARHFNTGTVNVSAENNVGVLVGSGARHVTTVRNNTFDNIAEDGTIANTSIIRTQNSGGRLEATVTGNVIRNVNYQTAAGGRHVIGHVFEPVAYNAANYSNLVFENNTATNVTYTNTNREFVFIDYRNPASGGNVTVRNNTFTMPTSGSQQAIELRFRQTNASTVNLLATGNSGSFNTAVAMLDVDAEMAGTVNATLTGNTLTNANATPGNTIDLASETAGTSTLCGNVSGNTLQSGTGTIGLNQTGTMRITQASAGALATANSIPAANVSVTGTPLFGQPACTTP